MNIPTGRDNGLPAARRYEPLVDVDPPVADHVLDLLREAHIAAVAEPFAGMQGITRETPPPRRPTDRVHVDAMHWDVARAVVGAALPSLASDFLADAAHRSDEEDMRLLRRWRDLPPDLVDERFADIVSGFERGSADPVPRWSALEDLPDQQDDEVIDNAVDDHRPPLSARLLRRGADLPDAPDEPEDGYVPPPPPPLPQPDSVTRLAWAGLLGGPGLLVLSALLGLGLQSWVIVGALLAFLAGFGTLVARMRDHRDDDGWDDGAVV